MVILIVKVDCKYYKMSLSSLHVTCTRENRIVIGYIYSTKKFLEIWHEINVPTEYTFAGFFFLA